MIELLIKIFTHKQLFTGLIICLYVSNFIYQFTVTKDYVWGGYWVSAACITIFSMLLSQR